MPPKRIFGAICCYSFLGTESGARRLPFMENKRPQDEDPRETPLDDPRLQTDTPHHRQTNEPWKGNPEKDQIPPDRPDFDLEKWQQSNTH
jgi:hypothetical protein